MQAGIIDESRVFDGFDDLRDGVDYGRRPDSINPTQAAGAKNVIFREGLPGTRPPFADLTHSFDSEHYYHPDGTYDIFSPADADSISTQTCFESDVFQGAAYFAPGAQPACIMASVGGRLFRILPEANRVIHITEAKLEQRNSSQRNLAYLCQADRFMVVQDGESKPIIFDGVSARRARENEIPVGNLMAYGMGRLVVVAPNRRDIFLGDLYGSHGDAADAGESVLRFEETLFLNEGFPARTSAAMGQAKALAFAPQQDSATGDGELLVICEHGIQSLFLSLPREQWKESAFQRVTLLNVGGTGHRLICSVNGDTWWRAPDGWRSYRQARAQIEGWHRLPQSTEVRPWMENDTPWLLEHGSAILFNNRLHGTCSPQPNNGRPYHLGLTSLDFDVLSSFGQATRPAWDGHWSKGENVTTGQSALRILQLVTGTFDGVERAFVFALDGGNQNHVYELMRDGADDWDGPIDWELVPRAMTCQSPQGATLKFNEKEVIMADMWIDHVRSPLTITLDYKPDQVPDWVEWKTLPTISPVGECGAVTCGMCPTIRDGFFPRRTVGKPPDTCDDNNTMRLFRRGFEFLPRIRGRGTGKIRRFRLHALLIPESPKANC